MAQAEPGSNRYLTYELDGMGGDELRSTGTPELLRMLAAAYDTATDTNPHTRLVARRAVDRGWYYLQIREEAQNGLADSQS